jgi:hypothetical protein
MPLRSISAFTLRSSPESGSQVERPEHPMAPREYSIMFDAYCTEARRIEVNVALIDEPAMAHHERGVEVRITPALKLRCKPAEQVAIHALRIRCPDHPTVIEVRRVHESSWATGCAGKAGRSLTPSSRGCAETWPDQPENQTCRSVRYALSMGMACPLRRWRRH